MKTITDILNKKKNHQKISMLTGYDYYTSKIISDANIDILLVGDSLGMAVLGYNNTLPVTMEDMLHHLKAVVRGNQNCMVIADMPYLSYHITDEEAIRNAGRFIKDGGAQGVKLEGGIEFIDIIKKLILADIPVMGHIGLSPQSVYKLGGFKTQGKTAEPAYKIYQDAVALEKAGVFSLVLESIPYKIAQKITDIVSIPTIGIGAGKHCDGQVLVINDILGLGSEKSPKFTKKYADVKSVMYNAIKQYQSEVESNIFPDTDHSYEINDEEYKSFLDLISKECK